jgi:thiol-disulfide isomerase/thioredoxin
MKKLLLVVLLPFTMIGQHTLKGNFAVEDGYKFAILYRIAPGNLFYVTDSNMNTEGVLEIPLSEDAIPGVYRLVYNLPQDEHFFDFLYNGNEDVELNFSEDKDVTYITSDDNIRWSNYRKELKDFDIEITGLMTATEVSKKDTKKVLKRKKKWFKEVQEAAKGTFSETFITNTQPYIADNFESKSNYNAKAKEAHLKHLDFSNPLIQNSSIPLEQSLKYIFTFVDQDNITVSREENMDAIAESLKMVKTSYQINLLENIYNFLVAQQEVKEANYLAKKHLIPLAQATSKLDLANRLKTYMSLSIGSVAPTFMWTDYDPETDTKTTNSLNDIEGHENYVIVFWSSLCSHCLKEIPLLHKKIEEIEEREIKVIAVGLEDFEEEWAPKAAQFPKFINVIGLGKWDNEIGNKYDVTATPSYFFLDSEKKIKAKPETLEELLLLIDARE